MSTTDTPSPWHDAPWYTPTIRVKLADGSTLLRTGKPVQRATPNQTSTWTRISKKNLRTLAECGFIRESRPTPWTLLYYPEEVEEFLRKTEEDPNFWNRVRRDAYITARRLRDKRQFKTEDGETEERREDP